MLNATELAFFNKWAPLAGLGSVLAKDKMTMRCTYDFTVLGGAIGSVILRDAEGNPAVLPDKAVITQVYIDTITTPTSGGAATIAINANSAGDLKAALAIASYTGIIAGIPVGTAATMVKLTAQRNIVATIAAFVLTAGKFDVFVDYVLGQ